MKYFTIHLEIKQCIQNKINKIQMRKYTMQMENYSEQMEKYTKQMKNIKCRREKLQNAYKVIDCK